MQYRCLGRTGLRISAIGLGSYLTIGMSMDEDEGRATFRRALELGINFIDTADAYNRGEAEAALGRYLDDVRRGDLVLATKVWAPMGDGPNDRGLSHKHIFEGCHASLRRLKTDYIDLYQCHRPHADTPLEETVRVMDDLSRQGKVLYWGVSEWPAWMIAQANGIAERYGWRAIVSNQPRYNLLYRQPEMELFPYCRRAGVGNVVFSPLAHGVLTGKYEPGQEPPAGTRAADPKQNMVLKSMYWKPADVARAQRMNAIAADLGIKTSQLALAWVLRREEVGCAIMGASKVSQVEDNAAAAEVTLSPETLRRLDEIFPPLAETYPF